MADSRSNHLNIDGAQQNEVEDDHPASYRPIPESDTDVRASKNSLAKIKEKLSSDGAEEKLLAKEDEAKITTRVDMTDAKYVVGDHRNGDAKIELDANKKQFSGLTKEELLKYADDPFWVRLRWFMFVLFWALWLGMLAGAIVIIIRAPKCAMPEPKTWYEKGPLVDMGGADYAEIESKLPILQSSSIEGVFIPVASTYQVLDDLSALDSFKLLVEKAKKIGVRLVVELIPNFVSTSHPWFLQSQNRSADYDTYFIWTQKKDFDEAGKPKPPNKWVSTANTPAWAYSENRNEFYLQLHGANTASLNFRNPAVVKRFDDVLKAWIEAGAAGVRLSYARQLLVNASLADELPATDVLSRGADHSQYNYWRHKETADQPDLDSLLAHWAKVSEVAAGSANAGKPVYTILESGEQPELFLLQRDTSALDQLRPRASTAAQINGVVDLRRKIQHWPALQLKGSNPPEVAEFAMLLPATPVFTVDQLGTDSNDTLPSEKLEHLAPLRNDASIEQGHYSISDLPSGNSTEILIALARWKLGHTGYMAVYNPNDLEGHANLTLVPSVPGSLSIHHVSHATKHYTNYTSNMVVPSDKLLVPPKSTVVVSYVPQSVAEK